MRPARLLPYVLTAGLAALAIALGPAAGLAATPTQGDPSAIDLRCIVVSGALSHSTDTDVQSLGRASLFYFMGRLDARGATNIPARVADTFAKMSADDVQAQLPICSGLFTAASQSLQSIDSGLKSGPPVAR